MGSKRNGDASTDEILNLWKHLFDNLQGYLVTFTGEQASRHRADGRINELDNTKQRSWDYPDEAEDAARYLLDESRKGRDAYFGAHLFKHRDNRLGKNALREILALWVDGDGAKVPEDWPQPTAIIESSPGKEHYYWALSRPISPEQATSLTRRLAYGMGADTGKWGLGTVLRAPGTTNFKYADQPLVSVRG